MKFRDLSGAIRIVLGAIIGITIYANFGPQPEPEFKYIKVPVKQLVKSEPDTVVKFAEKIVYRTVKPTQVVVADSGATKTVETFCKAAADSTSNSPETAPSAAPALIRSGKFDGRKLTLFEAVSNGDLRRSEFAVHSPFTFAERDSGVLVQSPRLWWVKPLAKDLLKVGVGYGIGRLSK